MNAKYSTSTSEWILSFYGTHSGHTDRSRTGVPSTIKEEIAKIMKGEPGVGVHAIIHFLRRAGLDFDSKQVGDYLYNLRRSKNRPDREYENTVAQVTDRIAAIAIQGQWPPDDIDRFHVKVKHMGSSATESNVFVFMYTRRT
jgi:hypothetical protein